MTFHLFPETQLEGLHFSDESPRLDRDQLGHPPGKPTRTCRRSPPGVFFKAENTADGFYRSGYYTIISLLDVRGIL